MNAQFQLLILAALLAFLSAFTLLLHRSSARFGLGPLMSLMGGMIVILQFRFYELIIASQSLSAPDFMASAFILLPPFLLGLLMIYVINGSLQARYTLIGSILIVALIAIWQSLSGVFALSWLSLSPVVRSPTAPTSLALGSALILSLDMALLIAVYQGIAAWRQKNPSLLASSAALCAALVCDAVMYSALVNLTGSSKPLLPPLNLAGLGLSALIICAMAAFYLRRYPRLIPDSAAANRDDYFRQTLTETTREGLLITDKAGVIVYANPAISEMLDHDLAEILGQSLYTFMTERQGADMINNLLPELQHSKRVNSEVEVVGRDNRSFSAELTIAQVDAVQHPPGYYAINLRDSTRSKVLEHRLVALNRFTTELVQIREPGELFEMVLSAGEELLEADASALCIGSTMAEYVRQVHTHRFTGALHCQLISLLAQQSGELSIFDRSILPVENMADLPLTPEAKAALDELGFQACIQLPVQFHGTPMGILGLYYRQPRQYDDATLQLGVTAAHTLAIALQNARLYQSEHNQRQYAEAIVHATEALNSSLELDRVLSQILEQTYRVVPCNSVNLMLVEDDHAVVVRQLFLTPTGEIESLQGGPELPLTTPTLFRMLSTGQPIVISDTHDEPDWKVLQRSSWIRSYASAPLQIRQEVIGFLNVNSQEPDFFNEESLRRLHVFASHAAAALHNARLYSNLQEYSVQLEDRVDERTTQLSLAKERIEAILESVPDAVYVLDNSENLLESNQAGSLLLNQIEQVGGKLFDAELVRRLKSCQDTDEQAIIEVAGRAYQALSSPLPLPDQQAGIVIVFRDVTRFSELDRMKTQFVSDVSHELRTPLTNLSLFLDLLVNEEDERKRSRFQATLRRETNRLTELIEDLLTISRLESNRINFSIKEIDVCQLIQDIVDDRSYMANRRDLRLLFTRPLNLPNALADQALLTQVLSNILTNALIYTPSGGQIKMRAFFDQTDGKPWIKISVSDNGFGIDPEELPTIFERFYRGSASRKTGSPGTGLGLAISAEIMERMGGKITVTSQVGAGSTFTLWLQSVL